MSGAKLQLNTLGCESHLVGRDCVNLHRAMYHRHLPFATNMVEKSLNTADFSKSANTVIDDSGHLISELIIKVEISEVKFNSYSDSVRDPTSLQFAWVKNLGHALIEKCEIKAGGSEIFADTGDWMQVWSDATSSADKKKELAELLGDDKGMLGTDGDMTVPSSVDPETRSGVIKKAQTVYIPLIFPFCRHTGSALPVISPYGSKIELNVKFRNIESLCIRSPDFNLTDIKIVNASVWVNTVILDPSEVRRRAELSHEYLLDHGQAVDNTTVSSKKPKITLEMKDDVKALYWTIRNNNYRGQRFAVYQPYDWEKAREEAAKKLLLSSYDLDEYGNLRPVTLSSEFGSYDRDGKQYDAIDPTSPMEEARYVFDDPISRSSFDGQTLIGRLSESEILLGNDEDDLRNKVDGIIRIRVEVGNVTTVTLRVEKITYNTLTISDLSRRISSFRMDNRNDYIKSRDLIVWQHDNYGVYIDGSLNPLKKATIDFNSVPRQSEADGTFFNKIIPRMTHKISPPTGLNMFSFSMAPEQYQPTGHCNFRGVNGVIKMELHRPKNIVSDEDILDVYSLSYRRLRVYKGNMDICQ